MARCIFTCKDPYMRRRIRLLFVPHPPKGARWLGRLALALPAYADNSICIDKYFSRFLFPFETTTASDLRLHFYCNRTQQRRKNKFNDMKINFRIHTLSRHLGDNLQVFVYRWRCFAQFSRRRISLTITNRFSLIVSSGEKKMSQNGEFLCLSL